MPKPDILVAEDDEVLLSLYEKKFQMQGFSVRKAHDGQQVLDMMREKTPDVLILDIRMPKIDGLQVLQEFPKHGRKFPIIVLTNFNDDLCESRARELGADQYFVKKDMNMKKLLEIIKSISIP